MFVDQTIRRLSQDRDADPRDDFTDPQTVADAVTAPYEARLRVLQRWRARAADGDDPAGPGAVDAALKALQMHAALAPQDSADPKGDGYGATSLRKG